MSLRKIYRQIASPGAIESPNKTMADNLRRKIRKEDSSLNREMTWQKAILKNKFCYLQLWFAENLLV